MTRDENPFEVRSWNVPPNGRTSRGEKVQVTTEYTSLYNYILRPHEPHYRDLSAAIWEQARRENWLPAYTSSGEMVHMPAPARPPIPAP